MHLVEKAKEEVVNTARIIYREGLVFETWGNVSARPTENEVVITPSGIPYEKLTFADIVTVNLAGQVEEGMWKPSTELPLHLAIYEQRKDIKAIVHTHSSCAVAFAVSRQDIPVVLEEQAQIVGGPVKAADYALPGSVELTENALKILRKEGSAVLLANHGLVGIGKDLATALQICRIIERSARIILWSKLLGSPYILSPGDVTELRKNFLLTYGQDNPPANSKCGE